MKPRKEEKEAAMLSYRIHTFAFVLDQQVGLRTQALNLERTVRTNARIVPTFVPVRYEADAGFLSRLPGVPGGIKGTLRGVREIRDGLREGGFDAILWATWAAKSVPDLVKMAPAFLVMDMTPTQMEAMGEQYGYSRRRARFGGAWKRRATENLYRQAAHFFPWNEWVAQSLRDDWNVPAEKITPVSPGVDTELFCPAPERRSPDVVRVLFVGGDFERKGGDLLVRWLRERQQASESLVELHLVTRSEDKTLDALPGVTVHRGITNNSPELVRLYQEADIFALPTRADCYSLVALEAMASGVPVIISRLGGISDIVQENKTGFLISPDDYSTLTLHLNSLIADPVKRIGFGTAGRMRAVQNFDCRKSAATVLATMKQIVDQNKTK